MAVSSETVVLLEVPFVSGREQSPHCSGSFSFLNFVLFSSQLEAASALKELPGARDVGARP